MHRGKIRQLVRRLPQNDDGSWYSPHRVREERRFRSVAAIIPNAPALLQGVSRSEHKFGYQPGGGEVRRGRQSIAEPDMPVRVGRIGESVEIPDGPVAAVPFFRARNDPGQAVNFALAGAELLLRISPRLIGCVASRTSGGRVATAYRVSNTSVPRQQRVSFAISTFLFETQDQFPVVLTDRENRQAITSFG